MSTATQEEERELQGPTAALLWHRESDVIEWVTLSYTGRMMPWRRASGLSAEEQAKARKGECVVIGGCPACRGTTWREVVYRGGRYRTRIPSSTVVKAVESCLEDWHRNVDGWRRVYEGVKEWDATTRLQKLLEYAPVLLELGLPTEHRGFDFCVNLVYKWDNHIPGDE